MRDELYLPLNRKLSAVFRKIRKEAGVTQAELAKRTGRTQAYISKFEAGQLRLDIGDFILLSEKLDADPHAILDKLLVVAQENRGK